MRDFDYSVNLLVSAFLKDELKHGSCEACAVANILRPVCTAKGIPFNRWANMFVTVGGVQYEAANDGEVIYVGFSGNRKVITTLESPNTNTHLKVLNEMRELTKSSPYTKKELMLIERSFETAPRGNSEDDWMFNGLMAVVEVLADIHNISLEAKEEAKKLFVKA